MMIPFWKSVLFFFRYLNAMIKKQIKTCFTWATQDLAFSLTEPHLAQSMQPPPLGLFCGIPYGLLALYPFLLQENICSAWPERKQVSNLKSFLKEIFTFLLIKRLWILGQGFENDWSNEPRKPKCSLKFCVSPKYWNKFYFLIKINCTLALFIYLLKFFPTPTTFGTNRKVYCAILRGVSMAHLISHFLITVLEFTAFLWVKIQKFLLKKM